MNVQPFPKDGRPLKIKKKDKNTWLSFSYADHTYIERPEF